MTVLDWLRPTRASPEPRKGARKAIAAPAPSSSAATVDGSLQLSGGEFLPDDAAAARRRRRLHGRRPGGCGRRAASGAAGDDRYRRHAMRLLHAGLRDGDVRVPSWRRACRTTPPSTRRLPAISAVAPAIARSWRPAGAWRKGPRIASSPTARRAGRNAVERAAMYRLSLRHADLSHAALARCTVRGAWSSTRSAILLARRHRSGLRVSKDREAFPAVISTASGRGAAVSVTTSADALEIGGARHLHARRCRISISAFPVLRRAGAPDRLAPDPQSRHHRRQSRHCLADRRHACRA